MIGGDKMIIGCETQNDCDRFYIPDKNSLDELKEYAKNNMPIKCYYVNRIRKRCIVIENNLKEVHLYLNNYLFYKDISDYYILLTQKEFDNFYSSQCKLCYKNKYSCSLRCNFDPGDNFKCNNYEKIFSFREWIKSKLP
jgi:hypothetical protein